MKKVARKHEISEETLLAAFEKACWEQFAGSQSTPWERISNLERLAAHKNRKIVIAEKPSLHAAPTQNIADFILADYEDEIVDLNGYPLATNVDDWFVVPQTQEEALQEWEVVSDPEQRTLTYVDALLRGPSVPGKSADGLQAPYVPALRTNHRQHKTDRSSPHDLDGEAEVSGDEDRTRDFGAWKKTRSAFNLKRMMHSQNKRETKSAYDVENAPPRPLGFTAMYVLCYPDAVDYAAYLFQTECPIAQHTAVQEAIPAEYAIALLSSISVGSASASTQARAAVVLWSRGYHANVREMFCLLKNTDDLEAVLDAVGVIVDIGREAAKKTARIEKKLRDAEISTLKRSRKSALAKEGKTLSAHALHLGVGARASLIACARKWSGSSRT